MKLLFCKDILQDNFLYARTVLRADRESESSQGSRLLHSFWYQLFMYEVLSMPYNTQSLQLHITFAMMSSFARFFM